MDEPPLRCVASRFVSVFVAGLAALLVSLTGCAADAFGAPVFDGPEVQLLDAIVHAGGTFRLSGAGWPPDVMLFVYLCDPARPDEWQPIISGQTDERGHFDLAIPYPSDPPWDAMAAVDVIVQDEEQTALVVRRLWIGSTASQPVMLTFTPPLAVPTDTPTPRPALTPTNTPMPVSPVISNWRGEYFDNPQLSGSPALIRNDTGIAKDPERRLTFDWGNDCPGRGLPTDGFSVRWIRPLHFAKGAYRFTLQSSSRVRFFIDGTPIISAWNTEQGELHTEERTLDEGDHALIVEMSHENGLASIDFSCERNPEFWRGEYFNNPNLEGEPVEVYDDPVIHFAWGAGSPHQDEHIPEDDFSARWTRTIDFRHTGRHVFAIQADDGFRVKVDGVPVPGLEQWHILSSSVPYSGTADLAAGLHTVVIEYYEHQGSAGVQFYYEPPMPSAKHWKGEYFNNENLDGLPVLVRYDSPVANNPDRFQQSWQAAPDPSIPPDHFSIRWTRTISIGLEGIYRFSVTADDGMRFIVDGALARDEWHFFSGTTFSLLVDLTAGFHEIRIELMDMTGNAGIDVEGGWVSEIPPTVTLTPTPLPSSTPVS